MHPVSRQAHPIHARQRSPLRLSLALVAALSVAPAMAVDVGDIAVHGYGHTSYFREDGSGSWDDSLVSLLFTAEVADRTRVWVQLHNTASVSHLDWAYVDYRVNAALTLRGGQIKLPIGLYNEIIDARFLQQSTLPPLMYQDGSSFTYENMRGVNASLTQALGTGSIVLTAYTGEVAPSPETPPTTVYHNLTGANVTYTPVEGLRLMASGFRSRVEESDSNLPVFGKGVNAVRLLSADYVNEHWDLKAEAGRSSFNGQKSRTAYAQVAYAVNDAIKPFVRYDTIRIGDAPGDRSRQTTLTLGLTYKVNDNVALRLEGHRNAGYALAYSQWLASSPGGTPDPDAQPAHSHWNMLGASVNFIF
ncbi:hypothetical protein [Duganella sp.]|uniref:hypothetical protein n=1 Tax=Duganella sp. TaxID=1904440 RepID=UPI0031D1A73B